MSNQNLAQKYVFISDYHGIDQNAKIEMIERYHHMFDDSLLRYIAFNEKNETVLDVAINLITAGNFKLCLLKRSLEDQNKNIVFGDEFVTTKVFTVKYKMTTCCLKLNAQAFLSIELLKTDSNYTNQGHARYLLTSIVQAARKYKIPMYLIVAPTCTNVDLKRLISFYRSVGFTFTPDTAKQMEINL